MLLPALKNARASAKGAVCLNKLKQSYLIFSQYANDYDGWGMSCGNYTVPSQKFWMYTLLEYRGLDMSEVWTGAGRSSSKADLLRCPVFDLKKTVSGYTSYGYSYYWGKDHSVSKISRPDPETIMQICSYKWYLYTNDADSLRKTPVHSNGYNTSWIDGSAKWVSYSFINPSDFQFYIWWQ
jgi:hypothetical protein